VIREKVPDEAFKGFEYNAKEARITKESRSLSSPDVPLLPRSLSLPNVA
jgi:hypothetical protein